MKIYHVNMEYESGTGKAKTREVLTKVVKIEDVRELLEQAHMAGQHAADYDIGNANYSDANAYAQRVIAEMEEEDEQRRT